MHEHKNDKTLINDFFNSKRDYDAREKSFQKILEHYKFNTDEYTYLEFGVAAGNSIKWWLKESKNPASRFYGFDTFEGLPESWGVFEKGDMISAIPDVNDSRASFVKGIFQDTLNDFLAKQGPDFKRKKKLIHMDADLFSATLFALSQLYPYLQKGDVIMFDEFNVYDHEYMAFKLFTDAFYVKLRLVAGQNNFYHAAFEVE